MTHRSRTVTVKQLPAKLNRQSERNLFRELGMAMQIERPAIVIDCSQVQAMNATAVHLLLCWLEEAMKRNGDVRLVGVSDQAMEGLRAMSVDRLFRIFETNERAIESFQRRTAFIPAPYAASALAAENAA